MLFSKQIRGSCGIIFPIDVFETTFRIFGLIGEEQKAEISAKTDCRKNGPILRKDSHLSILVLQNEGDTKLILLVLNYEVALSHEPQQSTARKVSKPLCSKDKKISTQMLLFQEYS